MSTTPMAPIEPDYTKPWVRGWEYVSQEGTSYIQREREKRGWTREQVYELNDHQILDPATQALVEGDYGVGYPFEVDHLVSYAVLFGTSPGQLLDAIYEEVGARLIAEDDG